ncbi:MAG: hypothetical protein WDN31_02615 [Hyphomicrobium sp.]
MKINRSETASPELDSESVRDNRDYVWGASKAAVVMFGVQESDPDFKTFRRRLFRTYAHWKASYYEAINRGRPLPVNPASSSFLAARKSSCPEPRIVPTSKRRTEAANDLRSGSGWRFSHYPSRGDRPSMAVCHLHALRRARAMPAG